MSDEIQLSEQDKHDIANLVLDGLMERFRLNVGKSVLDHVWKVAIGVFIAMAVYGYALSHK